MTTENMNKEDGSEPGIGIGYDVHPYLLYSYPLAWTTVMGLTSPALSCAHLYYNLPPPQHLPLPNHSIPMSVHTHCHPCLNMMSNVMMIPNHSPPTTLCLDTTKPPPTSPPHHLAPPTLARQTPPHFVYLTTATCHHLASPTLAEQAPWSPPS